MLSFKWEYYLSFIFGVLSIVLIFMIIAQLKYAEKREVSLINEIENVDSAGFILQDIPDLALNEHALDEYHELVERPLFFDERRPIIINEDEMTDEAVAEEQAVAEKLDISLIGIIKTPDRVFALFHNPNPSADTDKLEGQKYPRVQEGEQIKGWTVKEIKSDRIIVTSVNGSDEILLTKPRVNLPTVKKEVARKLNPFTRKINKK